MRRFCMALGACLSVCVGGAQAALVGDDPGAADKAALSEMLKAYVNLFNAHDAKGLAAHWSENGVYVDVETGEKTVGRNAILSDFEKLFKESPDAKLSASATDVRLVKGDVAIVDGSAKLTSANQDPNESNFTAVMVKADGKWVFDSVRETTKPVPESSASALKELEWLVGRWADQSADIEVDTTVTWAAEQSFLVRSYKVNPNGAEPFQGTQVIGWDARQKKIRSWNFDSDGSFGEGEWAKNGNEWVVVSSQTLADGRTASATLIFEKMNDDTIRVRRVGQEIDGEPQPASEPITVVRVPETAGDKK